MAVGSRDVTLLLKSENRQAGELQGSLNNNTRNLFIASEVITCGIMIEELQEDINTMIIAINDGKHGIIHPQILTPQMLIDSINEFETVHRTKYHFDAKCWSESQLYFRLTLQIVNPDGGDMVYEPLHCLQRQVLCVFGF